MKTIDAFRPVEVIAAAEDGTLCVIEQRSRLLPDATGTHAFFYCCMPDGRSVSWLGANLYQLPDGTKVRGVSSRLGKARTPN